MKMTEQPKGLRKGEFVGHNGFAYRLMHDDEGVDKNEDRYPANTFNEIYLLVIAVASVLTFLSEIVQMVAAFKELFK